VFGVVKGFIFRIHKYPIWTPRLSPLNGIMPSLHEDVKRYARFFFKLFCTFYSLFIMARFLVGKHHYDEICTECHVSAAHLDSVFHKQTTLSFLFK
jgi:hypothetical protein